MSADHYRALDIPEDATPDAVKAAWRKAVRKYHPDTGGEGADSDAFNRATEAWRVLGNPEQRRAYDRTRKGQATWSAGGSGEEPAMRREPAPRPAPPHGRTHDAARQPTYRSSASVPLAEAYAGRAEIRLKVEAMVSCSSCGGSGDAVTEAPCSYCRGYGQVGFGGMAFECPRCGGIGILLSTRTCAGCGGEGMRLSREEASVRLPNGIYDGAAVMVSMPSGRKAQVVLTIVHAKPWRFEDGELCLTRRFSAQRLLRGTTCTVRLPDARKVRLKVPPGTLPGARLRMPGIGMPDREGGREGVLVSIEES